MAEIGLEEERKYCKQVYEKWDFVKRIVELYAEGIAWQGCDKMDVNAIKNGVRSMLVTGAGDFNIKLENGTKTISVKMPSSIPFEEPGHPFLWPVTQNAKHLDDMKELLGLKVGAEEMLQMLVKDMCLGLGVPYELLGPTSATADGDAVMWGLTTFIGNVRSWRDYLGYQLNLNWNETWPRGGLVSYGSVYQVFKLQGIELFKLKEQVLRNTKSALDISLISQKTYEEIVKWFR